MTDLQIDLCINSCWPQAMFPLIYEMLRSCWTVQFFVCLLSMPLLRTDTGQLASWETAVPDAFP